MRRNWLKKLNIKSFWKSKIVCMKLGTCCFLLYMWKKFEIGRGVSGNAAATYKLFLTLTSNILFFRSIESKPTVRRIHFFVYEFKIFQFSLTIFWSISLFRKDFVLSLASFNFIIELFVRFFNLHSVLCISFHFGKSQFNPSMLVKHFEIFFTLLKLF